MVVVKLVDMRDGRVENTGCEVFGPFADKTEADAWYQAVRPALAGYGPTVRPEIEELLTPTADAVHIMLHGEVCTDDDCDFPAEVSEAVAAL